jgi:hypothetical protein
MALRATMSFVRKLMLVVYALLAPAIFALLWILIRGGPWHMVAIRMPLFDWSYLGVTLLSISIATFQVVEGDRRRRAIVTLLYLLFGATVSGFCGELLYFSIFYRDN